jgi:hypothetical protein
MAPSSNRSRKDAVQVPCRGIKIPSTPSGTARRTSHNLHAGRAEPLCDLDGSAHNAESEMASCESGDAARGRSREAESMRLGASLPRGEH